MPNPHRSSWVPLQWQATNFWAGLLPSLGTSGYYGVISLPQNLIYIMPWEPKDRWLLSAFFPPHFRYLSSQSAFLLGEEEDFLQDVLQPCCHPFITRAQFSPRGVICMGALSAPMPSADEPSMWGLSGCRLLGSSQTPHLSAFTQFYCSRSHPRLSIQTILSTLALLLLLVLSLTHTLPFVFPSGQL